MFGYVNINKMELRFREYYKYKGLYCGLCMKLKKDYSELSRLTLNYDMTFLILLLSSLYEVKDDSQMKRCIVHPVKKQLIIQNEITDYAAAMNIMLAYYNCKDNWMDEKDLKSLIFSSMINRDFKKTIKLYEHKQKFIMESLDKLSELEKANCDNLDDVSNVFGNLMGELMVYKNDHWEKSLRKIGFFLGKYIYILDAFLDMEEDKKNKSYNPLLNIKFNEDNYVNVDIDTYVKDAIMLNLSFLYQEVDKLPLIKDKEIIDNILLSGIMTKYNNKTKEEKSNERSI